LRYIAARRLRNVFDPSGPRRFSSIPPVHASWLNQIEIYFSIVQRKVLIPNDFSSLTDLKERLLGFQERYQKIASPFQ